MLRPGGRILVSSVGQTRLTSGGHSLTLDGQPPTERGQILTSGDPDSRPRFFPFLTFIMTHAVSNLI